MEWENYCALFLWSNQRARPSAPLSRDPLADVWIAIHQRDICRFAASQKTDAGFARQSHILEVENDATTLRLRLNERFPTNGDMLIVDPAAYS